MECLALPLRTTVHITPSYYTSTSRSTLFHFAVIYFKSQHIGHNMHHTTDVSHCTPFHITDIPHNATSVSDHIIYWPHHLCTPPHLASHHILHKTLHRTRMLHILHHSTTSDCDHTNSTSHCRVSHNIPHHTSVHRHILHPTTCHISHNTTSTTTPCHGPHSTSYNVPHSMP